MALDSENKVQQIATQRFLRIKENAIGIKGQIDYVVHELKKLIDDVKADQNNFDEADVQKLEAQYNAFKQMLVAKYNQLPSRLT